MKHLFHAVLTNFGSESKTGISTNIDELSKQAYDRSATSMKSNRRDFWNDMAE